jgi:hypothetical protein
MYPRRTGSKSRSTATEYQIKQQGDLSLHWEANLIHRPTSSLPRYAAAHGGRERACRGKEDAWLGCRRRKKRGALARGRPRPPLLGCPRPSESCGGGAAWRRSSVEEKVIMASSISGVESSPSPG